MQVKRYEVFDMKEAMEKIKHDLGPDAVILSTKTLSKSGSFGMFSRPRMEVTAAIDDESRKTTPKPAQKEVAKKMHASYNNRGHVAQPDESQSDADVQRILSALKQATQEDGLGIAQEGSLAGKHQKATRKGSGSAAAGVKQEHMDVILQELRELKSAVHSDDSTAKILESQQQEIAELKKILMHLATEKYSEKPRYQEKIYQDLYQKLISAGVDRYICRKMVDALREKIGSTQDKEILLRNARQLASRIVPMHGPIEVDGVHPKVVALVGPTGVGKTTTIAKLAAEYLLQQGVSVGLITLDTYRIAAVEQLKTYAGIIKIPVEVVNQNDSLLLALRKNLDKDLVLIDTAGRSHRDKQQIEELMGFLREEKVKVEVHLVLNAGTKERDLGDIIKSFEQIGIDRTIITKLDESNSYGGIFNCLAKHGLGVSYFTNGQDVPNDLVAAGQHNFFELLMGAESEALK
ncbi:flagellar biosynthesis protein FlhF [Desulfurispira natronophila]|uniref:Flagellar biosynthesis protein FlhF n=1 Tax=Desulfurispira natronophila TaxID=682562 RepID=A0A7W8DGI4_9BACT|nr:flagellar biosynthesis protein FlhF [Desulfurispira natronophila]MBB5021422.1 flagellar biosynthesis protein FlhF [Desulfurispira natronophila]